MNACRPITAQKRPDDYEVLRHTLSIMESGIAQF